MAVKSGPSAELGALILQSLSFLETGPFCYCSSSGVCILSFLLKPAASAVQGTHGQSPFAFPWVTLVDGPG